MPHGAYSSPLPHRLGRRLDASPEDLTRPVGRGALSLSGSQHANPSVAIASVSRVLGERTHHAEPMNTEPDLWAWGWTAVGSIATALAVAIALVLAILSTRDLIRTRKREADDRRREQALRVSAWATSESDSLPDTPRTDIGSGDMLWFAAIHVLNGSAAAISEVRVELGYLF